jgi:hypothetical protein
MNHTTLLIASHPCTVQPGQIPEKLISTFIFITIITTLSFYS